MDQSVNFSNLREITGGDAEMEAELFQLFLSSSSDCMNGLLTSFAAGDPKAWRDHAHALKGISYNLGAASLGEICKKAQEDYEASPDAKKAMLAQIEAELEIVKKAIAERK